MHSVLAADVIFKTGEISIPSRNSFFGLSLVMGLQWIISAITILYFYVYRMVMVLPEKCLLILATLEKAVVSRSIPKHLTPAHLPLTYPDIYKLNRC